MSSANAIACSGESDSPSLHAVMNAASPSAARIAATVSAWAFAAAAEREDPISCRIEAAAPTR